MRAFIIEYRRYCEATNEWSSKISQEGYGTLEGAQSFIEGKPGNPTQITPMCYRADDSDEYRIHDILIRQEV